MCVRKSSKEVVFSGQIAHENVLSLFILNGNKPAFSNDWVSSKLFLCIVEYVNFFSFDIFLNFLGWRSFLDIISPFRWYHSAEIKF